MRQLFVAGHSDSDGRYLPSGALTWAEQTVRWLGEASAEPWELRGVRFAPMGTRAVDYLTAAITEASPDLLVIPFTGYVCTVQTVSEAIRQRFGRRAARLFSNSERRFHERTRDGRARKKVNGFARRATRRVFGARALTTVEETTRIYSEVLERISRLEQIQVVVVADARFSRQVQEREPEMHRRFDQMYATLLPLARRHRFVVLDL